MTPKGQIVIPEEIVSTAPLEPKIEKQNQNSKKMCTRLKFLEGFTIIIRLLDEFLLWTALKGALRAKGVSYKDLAESLSLSEASIKRIFSTGSFSLDRFLEICEVSGITPQSLFSLMSEKSAKVYEYSEIQEQFFVENPNHLSFFDLLLKGNSPKSIAKKHELTITQVQKFLRDLEKIDLVDWLAGDRAKLKVSRNVRWRKGGPLKQKLLPKAREEFLRSSFEDIHAESKFMLIDLSERNQKKLKVRFHELIEDLSKDSSIDQLAKSKRETIGIFLAYRPWNFSLLKTPKM